MKIQISLFTSYVGRPFLGHHYYILSLYDLGLGSREEMFYRNNAFLLYDLYDNALTQEIHQFYTFYLKLTSPIVGGHEIYSFSSPHPTNDT